MFFSFSPTQMSASAATKSSGTNKCVITVVTEDNWWFLSSNSITLTQTKGEYTRGIFKKVYKGHGEWNIVAVATDGSHRVKTSMTGKSKKIKLKEDKVYKITVTWDNIGNLGKTFKTNPTWRVSKTKNVSSCY